MSLEARPQALQLVGGFMITQALGIVARAGIAYLVAEPPRTVVELAAESGIGVDGLARVVRALASVGAFRTEDGLVRSTAVSDLLREDAPGSIRSLAIASSGEHHQAWGTPVEDPPRLGRPASTCTCLSCSAAGSAPRPNGGFSSHRVALRSITLFLVAQAR